MGTIPEIIDVYPSDQSIGISINDSIRITFDQEMDLDSLNTGTVVLIGPDNVPIFDSLSTLLDFPGLGDEDILSSPNLQGYTKGSLSFSKVDENGEIVPDSTLDVTGNGDDWRTVVTFIPEKPLSRDLLYKIFLLGNENSLQTGIRTRTVFDTISQNVNPKMVFYGGYTGTNSKIYFIEITVSGEVGDAEYIWWESTSPLDTFSGITTTGVRELSDGVYVMSEPDVTYTAGEIFSVNVLPPTYLVNNYEWTFSTGATQPLIPPSTSPVSGINEISSNTAGQLSSSLKVLSISPSDSTYGVTISTDPYVGERITIVFSNNLLESSLVGDAVIVKVEPNLFGYSDIRTTIELEYTVSYENNILYIDITPGQLYLNNNIFISLSPLISTTTGVLLGEKKEYFFTTLYSPLYTGERRLRLELGQLLTSVPQETIMLAINQASRQVDANTFSSASTNTKYLELAKIEYATCLAEIILLNGLMNGFSTTSKVSKTLGDFNISKNIDLSNLNKMLSRAEDCVSRYQVVIQSGGNLSSNVSLLPGASVKGAASYDAITVHRQWEGSRNHSVYSSHPAGGNAETRPIGRRSLKTFRKR